MMKFTAIIADIPWMTEITASSAVCPYAVRVKKEIKFIFMDNEQLIEELKDDIANLESALAQSRDEIVRLEEIIKDALALTHDLERTLEQ